ncbi:MAG: hypothetical protein HY007_02075, partial [Candidatus Sungbacteria bacterium]|nr:hypothetical protein [Candidatus Sungbacteria bacterium]
MKKYIRLFASNFSVALEYRSNLIGVFVLELVSISSMVILWIAVYRTQHDVAGYTLYEAIVYYIDLLHDYPFCYDECMINLHKLLQKPKVFQRLTGLTPQKFMELREHMA